MTALHGTRCSPVAVQSGAVFPCFKRHFKTEIVACGVFQSLHQPVVKRAPEVVSLLPRHVTKVTQCAKSKLCVCLVAPCFLTLSRLAYVIGQRPVVVTCEIVFDTGLIKCAVAEEYGTGHAQTVDDSTPVAVGIWAVGLKLLHHRQHDAPHHSHPLRRLHVLQFHH